MSELFIKVLLDSKFTESTLKKIDRLKLINVINLLAMNSFEKYRL